MDELLSDSGNILLRHHLFLTVWATHHFTST